MLTLLALNLRCPKCGKSLMDHEHNLDNHSSIRLEIQFNDKRGWLRLSSIYGSSNISSQYPIPEGVIARFFCPSCSGELKSPIQCNLCLGNMIPFALDEGGNVFICSRRGCKKHFLEFEDVEDALSKFYQHYSFGTTFLPPAKDNLSSLPAQDFGGREVIANRTFLNPYCPHCRQSVLQKNTVNFTVKNRKGEEGTLSLSPYLNVFTHKSTIVIPEGEEVSDLKCCQCKLSLIDPKQDCETCGSHAAQITISAMRKLIPFYICLKKGCTWHGLSNEDTNLIALEDSLEW